MADAAGREGGARPAAATGGGRGVWLPASLLSLPLHHFLLLLLLLLAASPVLGIGGGAPRYSLLPLAPSNDSTFLIHFHPPSIVGLKVHSSQRVYFNCTQIKRHSDRRQEQQQQQQHAARPSSGTNTSSSSSSSSNSGSNSSGRNAATTADAHSSHTAPHNANTTTTTTHSDNNNQHHHRRPHQASTDSADNNEEKKGGQDITTTTSTTTTDTNTTDNNNNNNNNNNNLTTAAWGQPHHHNNNHNNNNINNSNNHHHNNKKVPRYWAMIFSSDDKIARPVPGSSTKEGQPDPPDHARVQLLGAGGGNGGEVVVGGGIGGGGGGSGAGGAHRSPRYLLMAVQEGEQHNFSIQALHVGRVTMSVAVLGQEAALLADNGQLPHNKVIQAVATSQFPVSTVRGQRTADLVFDSSAAAIAILITFGIGCCTDTDSLRRQLKFPVSLIIGFCCQFILMPVLAFGLAMALPIEKDIRFGLLCTACVPGGGLGHIAVIIGEADIPLSLTMNLISVVAMLGTAPLWIFVLGQYFQTDPDAILSPRIIPIYNFEIWLGSIFLAYAAGLMVNRFRPVVADMLLTWVIKPFLLLATILYITVGVYINMYVFELINYYAVLGAILLPLIGCLLGCSLAVLCRQKASFVKTIALETSSLNCLIVLAALRFSLQQPDADLASMIPIWVMFTIPGLYVALAILQRFYNTVHHYWTSRRSNSGGGGGSGGSSSVKDSPSHKEYDVASAIVSRPGIAALSAPLVVADGVDDDPTHNEKVTVL